MHKQTLGVSLRMLRVKCGLSLREVTDRSTGKVSHPYLSQLETGRSLEPSPHILRTLGQVYGVSYEKMLRLAGYWP